MPEYLKQTIDGHTAILTLNNPPANTWTLEGLNQLREFVLQLNQRSDIVALILNSENEKFFSAGADLKLFDGVTPEQARPMAEAFGKAFEALTDFQGVSIAAINGYAMGGGLEVALACDFRIAEERAVMALPEASVGLLPCAGGTQNLTALVGEVWAKRMILCGERVDARKALELGLVEEVVAPGQSLESAKVMAGRVSGQSPDAVVACKQLIQASRAASRSALVAERELFVELFKGDNQQEGVKAFLEKRKPEWKY